MTAPTWLLSEAGEQTQWKSYVGIFSGVNRCSWWHQWVSVPKVMPFSSPWSVLLIQWSVCAPSNIRQGDPTAVQPYPFSQDLIIDNATSDRSRKGPNHHIWQGKVQTEFVVGPLSWHRRWHDHCNIPCKIIPGLLVSSCHNVAVPHPCTDYPWSSVLMSSCHNTHQNLGTQRLAGGQWGGLEGELGAY